MQKRVVPIAKEECCGCTMCADICPVGAIKIVSDDEGFSYPKIDEKVCISCGLCSKTCGFANRSLPSKPDVMPKAFISKHKDDSVRLNSRSGAFFVSCSDYILEQGGVVYGCILNDDVKAVHIRTQDKAVRNKMCGSKYVQSDTSGIFSLIKKDLESGLKVLFTGTGCQVHAVCEYLKQKKVNTDNFYSMDIICHGAPSPKIFAEYVQWAENKYNDKMKGFIFRDKNKRGWDNYVETAIMEKKSYTDAIYRGIFNSDCCIRPSCYNCKYTSVERVSDFTIGDAWGIKKNLPEFDDNKGVSIVIVNSDKAESLLNIIKDGNNIKNIELENWLQPNLLRPSKAKYDREKFWNDYCNGGIDLVVENYGKRPLSKKISEDLKYTVRKITKKKGYYLP